MPLLELRDWNEDDFVFLGFGWDYEGGLGVEADSKLGQLPFAITLSMSDENYDLDYLGDIHFLTQEVPTDNSIYVETFSMSVE